MLLPLGSGIFFILQAKIISEKTRWIDYIKSQTTTMQKKLILLIFFSVCIAYSSYSQKEKGLIQFSGIVVSADSLTPIPFANIIDLTTRRGTITDYHGFFSFAAYAGNEIYFSCIGYKSVIYRIPDTLTANRYSLIQALTADTIMLSPTVIYPWPTIEQFKNAFLSLRIPDDDLERAKKNLERAALKDILTDIGQLDAQAQYTRMVAQQAYNFSYKGLQRPSLTGAMNNPLLNPFAWAEFIKAWKEGKFKRNP